MIMPEEHERVEEWLNLTAAAKEVGISRPKLAKMVQRGTVRSKIDPFDDRVTLVDIVQLRKLREDGR